LKVGALSGNKGRHGILSAYHPKASIEMRLWRDLESEITFGDMRIR